MTSYDPGKFGDCLLFYFDVILLSLNENVGKL